ncbi:unnamed protein product [Allacma fusca]|uniref:C2H2-type domain-containing protein n=1 Tax=Allacma fusca TaxID=39272 RepID=A0A8J2JEV4_9HEXA|nr:unnamed protein product [Allacma fusca]
MQESTFKKKNSFLKRTVFTHSKITKTVKARKVSKMSKSTEHQVDEVTKTERSPTSNKIPDHIKIMGSETNPIYECMRCLKRFRTRQNIKYHAFCGQETSKPFKCDICPRWFSIKSHYKYHMMTHRKDMPFKCSSCPKAYPDQQQLDRHSKYHSDARTFMCDQCGRSFHTQNILDNHMFVHSGRPFQCKYCSKTFARLVFLNKHELVHVTGEKPFKCTMCDTSLCRKDGLERHVLNVHKMDPRTLPSFSHIFQSSPKQRGGKKGSKLKSRGVEDPVKQNAVKIKVEKDTDITHVENGVLEEPQQVETQVIQETVNEDSWKKKLQEAIVIDEGDGSITTTANFDAMNRVDFMELKLDTSFSRPYICPMCGNSFAHQDDVDWHVRMMHSSADSCSSQSDHGIDSRQEEPMGENHVGTNIMALFNGHESPISYEIIPHAPSSSEFVQPLAHCSTVNNLEFTGPMMVNHEFPAVSNGPSCDYIEPTHVFTEPYLGQNQGYNTGSHYIEPACGPGFTYQQQPPPNGLESEKFNDLTTLSTSFNYNHYEQTPEHMAVPEHHANGVFFNSQQTMFGSELEYLFGSGSMET